MDGLRSRYLGRRAAFVSAFAALLVLSAPGSIAQDDTQPAPRPGGLVDIVADGNDISAAGASVSILGTADDIRAAGANVTVRADATGTVQLAGAQVLFSGDVGEDLQVAGASVDLRGNVAGNVSVGGAVLRVNTVVGRDVFAGGANITIGINSNIAGALKVGGANVSIAGRVGGKVDAAGGLVTISANTAGDVEVRAGQVIVNPAARIGGDLIVYSLRDPVIEPGAEITGTVTRIAPPDWWQAPPWTFKLAFAVFMAAGTIVAGIVLMLFGGRVFAAATAHVRHRPLSSFLFGILTLVLVPFIGLALIATVVGISVGFAILLLMTFLIVFGHVIAAAGIASGIFMRRQGDIGIGIGLVMLIVGAILLAAITLIPYAGPLLGGIALVLGVGAFTRTVGGRLRRVEPPVAAAPAAPAPPAAP